MENRKHHDVIVAWAKGAVVQVFQEDKWTDVIHPCFSSKGRYRVKPTELVVGEDYHRVVSNGVSPNDTYRFVGYDLGNAVFFSCFNQRYVRRSDEFCRELIPVIE